MKLLLLSKLKRYLEQNGKKTRGKVGNWKRKGNNKEVLKNLWLELLLLLNIQ